MIPLAVLAVVALVALGLHNSRPRRQPPPSTKWWTRPPS